MIYQAWVQAWVWVEVDADPEQGEPSEEYLRQAARDHYLDRLYDIDIGDYAVVRVDWVEGDDEWED